MKKLIELAEKERLKFIGCPYAVLNPLPAIEWEINSYTAPHTPHFDFIIFENGEPAKVYRGNGSPGPFVDKLLEIAPFRIEQFDSYRGCK